MPARDATKPPGYYCDAARHKNDCPKTGCSGCLPPCSQRAGWGTGHPKVGRCKRHGGTTPNHNTAAEREQARLACELFGLEMADRDPGEVLLAEVTRTRRSIAWHETEIALAMVDADTVLADKRLVGWAAERKHLADVTAKALHAGVARRTLELQEDMARQLAAVMTRYTELLGLDPGDVRVREAGRGAMQLIAGGSA